MAIGYDNTNKTSSASNVASLTTTSWAIAGSNLYLVAGVASGASSVADPSSCKWGGSSGTGLTKNGATVSFGSAHRVSWYGLVAPTVQTSTLYCSWASNQDETALGGISFTGVDQSTPTGTRASATGSSTPITVNVTTAADDWAVDVSWCGDNSASNRTITEGANQTPRVEIEGATLGYECLGMSHETATGTTTTMSWTISGTVAYGWGIISVPLKPAAISSIEQEGFRFRNDDGNEDGATWKANQDVSISLATATEARIRMLINATGDAASKQFQLEYRHKPSGGSFSSWKKVP